MLMTVLSKGKLYIHSAGVATDTWKDSADIKVKVTCITLVENKEDIWCLLLPLGSFVA